MIDMRLIQKPDGLYRVCIVCGAEFRIESTANTTEQVYKNGERRVRSVEFGDRHPRNLMQVQCGACPPQSGTEHDVASGGKRDARASLRRDGLESWRDYSG